MAVASSIITRVRSQLIDNGSTQRWSDAELLRYLSDGQRTVVAISPNAGNKVAIVPLVAGTRQSIPADGHMLLGIYRNISGTSTPGRAVRIVTREVIDAQNPDWHTAPTNVTVQNYIYDPNDQRAFYVYPPNNGNGQLEMNYAVMPADLTSLNDQLVVQEIYQTALFDYVMARAHQKDSDFAAGQVVASQYQQAFIAFMTGADNAQTVENPNQQLVPTNMTVRGAAR